MRAILLLVALATAATLAPPAVAQTLLVGNKGEDSLSFVDLTTGREVRRVETGRMPHEIALSPDGREAAVVAYGGQTIEVFDVARAAKVRTIDLGANARPHGLIWLADGRIVAIAEGSGMLCVVARDGTISRIATGQQGSHMVAITPDARRAFVSNMKSGNVSELDLVAGRKVRDIAVGKEPEGLALSADGRTLWVADRGSDTLYVFDAASARELARLPTGKTPIRVAMTPDGRAAVVSNFRDGTVSVFDVASRKAMRTITVGRPGFDQVTLLFARDGRRLYVAETGIDRVAEVDFASGKVLGRLPAGKNGDGLAIAAGRVEPR